MSQSKDMGVDPNIIPRFQAINIIINIIIMIMLYY